MAQAWPGLIILTGILMYSLFLPIYFLSLYKTCYIAKIGALLLFSCNFLALMRQNNHPWEWPDNLALLWPRLPPIMELIMKYYMVIFYGPCKTIQ